MRHSPLLAIIFLGFSFGCLAMAGFLPQFHLVTPPIMPEKPDFTQIEDTEARKQAFFAYLTPMIEAENQRIRTVRQRLQAIQSEQVETGEFSRHSRRYIEELVHTYRFDDEELTTEEQLARLLRRVDIIPASLALAQAASESGWGSSRFAQIANNFFGQWCYEEGCGIVPTDRPSGAQHEVAKFDSVRDSVTSYFLNINTHYAYQDFRKRRQQIRDKSKEPRSADLLPTLTNYSERREEYLDDLRQIIQVNGLNQLEHAE